MSGILQSQLVAELISRCDGPALNPKVERCSKMTTLWAGYGAVYHLLVKENGRNSTKSLILKDVKPPKDSGVSHERKLHSYKVEAAFYQQLAVPLKQRGLAIATPYLAEHNLDGSTGTGSMHLILSDLREEYPNQHRPMDLAHAKAALSWLATLHASHWQRPIPKELWRQGCFWQLDTRLEELDAMEPEWRDLQRAAHHISEELANEKFQTLVHGDFKGANILFSTSGGNDDGPRAAAYDFQYCGGGDAMKDVAYLFCSAIESKVLQRHEEELLEHYHSELRKQLPGKAGDEYTIEIMKERLSLAICDFVRFMAGWGWWGNTSWASQKCRNHLQTLKIITRTAFAPDEFWQGPEVAHRMVFGYGHLTWEWAAGLRSYLHPSMYALFYWALKILKVDCSLLVAKGPQLVQAVFAAVADVHVYKLALHLFGPLVARWTIICQLLSWFNAYCLIRTYSTSVEASLTVLGVYLLLLDVFPSGESAAAPSATTSRSSSTTTTLNKRDSKGIYSSYEWIMIAAVCIAIRPSSALFWGATSIWYLTSWCPVQKRLQKAVHGTSIGIFVLACTAVWDRLWYQRWVFVPWEFFKFNLLHGGSELYGTHPWHWNFTCGLPVVFTTLLLLGLVGVYRAKESSPGLRLAKLVLFQLIAYSLPAHKEFRFLLPALQLAMPYCGLGAAYLVQEQQQQPIRTKTPAVKNRNAAPPSPSFKLWKSFAIAMLVLQIPVTLFFSLFHQRAQIQVMNLLQKSQDKLASSPSASSILFLTPCHTTPYYSYIHKAIPMFFLDCSPPGWADAVHQLNKDGIEWLQLPKSAKISKGQGNISERQQFEFNPSGYLQLIFKLNNKNKWPHSIVGFGGTMNEVDAVLQKHGYREKTRLWNCLLSDNECSVSVYERQEKSAKLWFS